MEGYGPAKQEEAYQRIIKMVPIWRRLVAANNLRKSEKTAATKLDSGRGRKGKGKMRAGAADDGVSSSDEVAARQLKVERAGAARAGVSGELPRCWIYGQQRRLRLRL
jgi:hypothetical protein